MNFEPSSFHALEANLLGPAKSQPVKPEASEYEAEAEDE